MKRVAMPTEHQIQAAFFDLVRLQYHGVKLIYAVPNGANKSPATAAKFKREGLMPGVLDVNIDYARGGFHGMRIEFKRLPSQTYSDEQLIAATQLKREGYHVELHCDALKAFERLIKYMRGEVIRG